MIVLKPDHDHRVEIAGVLAPVLRPVDIDRNKTCFEILRTLRIYRFERGSVVEGHAEEEEVFLVVLAGLIELTLSEDETNEMPPDSVRLAAPDGKNGVACAAYLPPHGQYKLTPTTDADVAYARAAPSSTARAPQIFFSSVDSESSGATILIEETSYAVRLSLRMVRLDTAQNDLSFMPLHESDSACEALVHIRSVPAANAVAVSAGSDTIPTWLDSWDTVAVLPGQQLTLQIGAGSTALALVVMAS